MDHFPTRTVVGAMFEFQAAWQAHEAAMLQPPHHRPPQHPVLYIKPANTWRRDGQPVLLPADVPQVQVGATLGISFLRTASRVRAADALQFVAGYCVVNDVTVPHTSLLRPPMRQKCRDGFCPIGPWVPASKVPDPGQLGIRAFVNGVLRQSSHTRNLRRSVPQLIADVSEFMSLAPGDLLLIGVDDNPPLVQAGDRMTVEIDVIGQLENQIQAEPAYTEVAA